MKDRIFIFEDECNGGKVAFRIELQDSIVYLLFNRTNIFTSTSIVESY